VSVTLAKHKLSHKNQRNYLLTPLEIHEASNEKQLSVQSQDSYCLPLLQKKKKNKEKEESTLRAPLNYRPPSLMLNIEKSLLLYHKK
jgi:hypothetical protein